MSNAYIYTHPETLFNISEVGETQLKIEVSKETSQIYSETFKNLGGKLNDEGKNDFWTLTKGGDVDTTINEIVDEDIRIKYSVPKPKETTFGSYYPPKVERKAAQCIGDYSEKGYKVYDYSEKSYIVVPSNEEGEQKLVQAGGKRNPRLYVNGSSSPCVSGVVFYKNKKTEAFLHSLGDEKEAKPPSPSSVGSSAKPTVVPGPFEGKTESSKPFNLSVDSLIKEVSKTDKLGRASRRALDDPSGKTEIITLWGPAELVNTAFALYTNPQMMMNATLTDKLILHFKVVS